MLRFIFTTLAAFFLVASQVTAADAPKPVVNGPEGQRAFDDLAKFYEANDKKPDIPKALGAIKNADKAAAKAAGQYLLALFKQSFTDETNGRAPWKKTPFFGGRSENDARNFRTELGEAFGKDASSEEALDAALWLLDEEMLAENQAAGMSALRRIKAPRAAETFKTLLAQPHPNGPVVQGVIEEIAARALKELAPDVTRLCTHYRTSVREAAFAALPKLGVEKIPEYKPEAAFTPWLDTQIKNIAAMVWREVPKDATFHSFTVTTPPYRDGEKPNVSEFSGWLLKDDKDSFHVLTTFGDETTLNKEQTKFAPRTLADEAEALLKIRTNAKDTRAVKEALSRRGGLTGQFEPGFISVPEALVGAWSYMRGDKKTAALLLFSRIDSTADDRWIAMATRDLLGNAYHQEMLNSFSHDRDYAHALELAKHLSKPQFDDYKYQDRAKEMAEQLAKRMDEFKTFVLPEPAEWEKQKEKWARGAQVKFLAEHLRLLNCIQMGQPGGVSYEDDQYAEAHYGGNAKNPKMVINPYVELGKMKLEIMELQALVPFLADENYLPTFSYWRDFHPNRTLHQVNWAVANVLNDVAKRDLAEISTYFSLDADGKKQHIAKILKWCADNAGKTREQLLLEIISQSKDWREVGRAAAEAAETKVAGALPALIARMNDFKDKQADLAELSFKMNDPAAAAQAREWLKSKNDTGVRFWSALILLRHGDKAKLEGLAELRKVLEADDGSQWYRRAIDALLATKNEEALVLACSILKRPRFDLSWQNAPIVHRLLLAGREEAVNFLLEKLDSTKASGTSSGTWKGKSVNRQQVEGDDAAQAIVRFAEKYEFEALAPEEERAQSRAALKTWLKEQFALIKAGKKSQIKPTPQEIQTGGWRIDAP